MSRRKVIVVQDTEIKITLKQEGDYVSISDIAKRFGEPKDLLSNWMRTRSTLEFLGVWEQMNNAEFNGVEFDSFLYEAGSPRFSMSPTKWINSTNAMGIRTKRGRNGGTTAHIDIALAFCYFLNPVFQLYLLKEFQRLKQEESETKNIEWNVRRIMSKANYRIHTEAIREHLIPPKIQNTKQEGLFFASEADLINVALFGVTAKQWREQNPQTKGNMRDQASPEQLLVLSNIQSLNAKLLKWGCDQKQRLQILNESAIEEMNILLSDSSLKSLKGNSKALLKSPKINKDIPPSIDEYK